MTEYILRLGISCLNLGFGIYIIVSVSAISRIERFSIGDVLLSAALKNGVAVRYHPVWIDGTVVCYSVYYMYI